MHISKVELIHREEIPQGTMQDGLPVAPQLEMWHFKITTDEQETPDQEVVVPADPLNRHYQEVKEWYDKQKKKPFKYDFK